MNYTAQKLVDLGYLPVTEKQLLARINEELGLKLKGKGRKERLERIAYKVTELFSITIDERSWIELAARNEHLLADGEFIAWETELMRPVAPAVVIDRVNSALQRKGTELYAEINDDDSVDMFSGDVLANSDVCLDSLAIDHCALADDEFLAWPVGSAKAA